MKLGLVTTSFPRFDGDVAGAFVLGFARALVGRGHEVIVLAPEPAEATAPPSWPGIRVEWVPYLRPRALERTFYGAGVPDNLRRDPRAWVGLASFPVALARRAEPVLSGCDALVSHWALPSALVAARVRGDRPHLAVLHSADVHALASLPGGGSLARRVARGASALLFVSEEHRDRFLGLLPPVVSSKVAGRCHVSAMGIDPPEPAPGGRRAARARAGLARFTVLSMGRLVPVKGIAHAIEAVAGRSDRELVIAGEGPERDTLVRLATTRRARVRFVGVATGERKRDLFAGSDAFVLPSVRMRTGRTEGLPTTLLEAMAAGLPVVASEVGGIGSVVHHDKNGLLVPPDRPDALGAALDRLAADRDLRRRLSRAALTTARRYFWPELAPHLEALLDPGSG